MAGFERFEDWTIESVEEMLEAELQDDLLRIPIVVTLHGSPDPGWSERICIRLSRSLDPIVRGNAILGLGHLARTEGLSNKKLCLATIEAGIRDDEEYVRGQGHGAAEDVEQYLKWAVSGAS